MFKRLENLTIQIHILPFLYSYIRRYNFRKPGE